MDPDSPVPTRPDGPGPAEAARLERLRRYEILDTAPEPEFDDLARLAAQLSGAPIAQINLIDDTRLWHKASIGYEAAETPREVSLCQHALSVDDMLVIPDARLDARFASNPSVAPVGGMRFYAGVPLRTDDGITLGTLCVADTEPRRLSPLQNEQLAILGRQVMAQLTLRRQRLDLEAELAARKAATEALSANERLLRSVLDHTDSSLVYAKDRTGRYTLVNRTMEAVLGRSAGELVGATDLDIFGTDVAREYTGNDEMIVSTGRRQVFGERLAHADGTVHDYLSTKFALRDASGTVYGIGGVSADVSELAEQRRALVESEQRWRLLFTGSPVGIAVFDEQDRIVSGNDALYALLGRPADAVVGRPSEDFTDPDDRTTRARTEALIDAADDGVARIERRYLHADGSYRWAWITATRLPGPDGERWILGHLQDITERKAVEDATVRSAADLAAMAAVAERIQQGHDARQTIVAAGVQLAGAAWVGLLEPTDPTGAALTVSASTRPEQVGVTVALGEGSAAEEVYRAGRPVLLAEADRDPRMAAHLARLGAARSLYLAPVRVGDRVTATLIVAWEQLVGDLGDRRMTTIGLLADQAGVALRQAGLVAELELLAATDPLTTLPNRRGWDRLLATAMVDAGRDGTPLSVALADLDHFKSYNDVHGHSAGDDLLRAFGSALRTALRRGDAAARWGGEEFAFALPDCPAVEASRVLGRFRAAVPMAQTCSIGFATWDGKESADALMARADQALYEAKHQGRDRIVPAVGEPAPA